MLEPLPAVMRLHDVARDAATWRRAPTCWPSPWRIESGFRQRRHDRAIVRSAARLKPILSQAIRLN